MATGYTHKVCEDGEPFNEFVWRCARAFGALVMQREEPMSAAPRRPETDTYYAQRLEENKADIERVRAMTDAECADASHGEHDRATMEVGRWRQGQEASNARVRAMIEQVTAWRPPTPEHDRLREFMLEQLNTSLSTWQHQDPPPVLSGPAWRAKRMSDLQRDHARLTAEAGAEVERSKSRQAWFDALVKSVPLPDAARANKPGGG